MPSSMETYHCLCSQFVLLTPRPLKDMPARKVDRSYICETSTWGDLQDLRSAVLVSVESELKPLVVKLEDGFEKRYAVKCGRCGVLIAYYLDKRQFIADDEEGAKTDILYIPAGGLVATAGMEQGEEPS